MDEHGHPPFWLLGTMGEPLAPHTMFIGVKRFPSWPEVARRWFILVFSYPRDLVEECSCVQMLQVNKKPALEVTWDYLCGKGSRTIDPDPLVLNYLPVIEIEWLEANRNTCECAWGSSSSLSGGESGATDCNS